MSPTIDHKKRAFVPSRSLFRGWATSVWLVVVGAVGTGCVNDFGNVKSSSSESFAGPSSPSEGGSAGTEAAVAPVSEKSEGDSFIERITQLEALPVEVREGLPMIPPIWKRPYTFDKGSGKLSFVGVGSLLALGRCASGEESRSLVLPSPTDRLCGFRLLGITSQCAWLEVVYTDPVKDSLAFPGSIRRRWPPADVDFAALDKGKTLSRVKFGGGYEASPGDSIIFEEGDRLLLDLEGAFLSRNAVLFRYQDKDEQPLADILCLTRLDRTSKASIP